MRTTDNKRVKRTQRDYNLGFKLAIVEQVEKGELTYKQAQNQYGIQGRSTVLVWLRRYGKLNWYRPKKTAMTNQKETPAQQIKRLERALEDERQRNLIYNEMIDFIDTQYGSSIRKKLLPKALEDYKKKAQ